jgi:hypothetical protein
MVTTRDKEIRDGLTQRRQENGLDSDSVVFRLVRHLNELEIDTESLFRGVRHMGIYCHLPENHRIEFPTARSLSRCKVLIMISYLKINHYTSNENQKKIGDRENTTMDRFPSLISRRVLPFDRRFNGCPLERRCQ